MSLKRLNIHVHLMYKVINMCGERLIQHTALSWSYCQGLQPLTLYTEL